MSSLTNLVERLRDFNPDGLLRLRAPYPPVALSVDRDDAVLVRVKPRRRSKPLLEAFALRQFAEPCIPGSIFDPVPRAGEELGRRLRELFESSGTRPARVSLVLPDNLAKVSLIGLPERPSSPRRLDELVRSKMRRAVPFRLDEARLSYQPLPGEGQQVGVLVVLVRKTLVESLEQALSAIGARVGLIDISTPNLLNLYRSRLESPQGERRDVALFNCAPHYFSLVIVRDGRLVFFRCKTFSDDASPLPASNGDLVREVAGSFSYYREKLAGQGIGTVLVRTLGTPHEEIVRCLRAHEVERVEPLDPGAEVELAAGKSLDPALAQRIAPAIGAAAGRAR